MSRIHIHDLDANNLDTELQMLTEAELALIMGGFSFKRFFKGIAEVAAGIFTVNAPLIDKGIDDIFQ